MDVGVNRKTWRWNSKWQFDESELTMAVFSLENRSCTAILESRVLDNTLDPIVPSKRNSGGRKFGYFACQAVSEGGHTEFSSRSKALVSKPAVRDVRESNLPTVNKEG